jgi:hypothetical protein
MAKVCLPRIGTLFAGQTVFDPTRQSVVPGDERRKCRGDYHPDCFRICRSRSQPSIGRDLAPEGS